MSSFLTLALGFLKNDELLGGMAKKLNISEDQVQKILVIAVPLLIQALSKNAGNKAGAEALFKAVSSDHDGSVLDKADDFLDNPNLKQGTGILKHVLGAQTDPMADQLAQLSGVDPKVAKQVLAMAAPVVLGAFGKMQSGGEFDASSLPGVLNSAREMAEAKVPGLMGVMKGLVDADGDGKIDDRVVQMGSALLSNLFK